MRNLIYTFFLCWVQCKSDRCWPSRPWSKNGLTWSVLIIFKNCVIVGQSKVAGPAFKLEQIHALIGLYIFRIRKEKGPYILLKIFYVQDCGWTSLQDPAVYHRLPKYAWTCVKTRHVCRGQLLYFDNSRESKTGQDTEKKQQDIDL